MPLYPAGPSPYGSGTAFDIASATVVRASPGILLNVNVVVAGSAAGAAFDSATTTGNTTSNQIAAIPAAVGSYAVNMPCASGIVIVPGTGQTLTVSHG